MPLYFQALFLYTTIKSGHKIKISAINFACHSHGQVDTEGCLQTDASKTPIDSPPISHRKIFISHRKIPISQRYNHEVPALPFRIPPKMKEQLCKAQKASTQQAT